MGEGIVLEARARQGHAGGDASVELGANHKQVVVPGLGIDMPGFALDQIAKDIVGHPRAQAAADLAGIFDRLIEHQGHFVVKTRVGGANLQGQRVDVGAMQEGLLQSFGQGLGVEVAGAAVAGPARGDDQAVGPHHQQLADIRDLGQLLTEQGVVQVFEFLGHGCRQFRQMLPVVARPVVQQFNPGFGNGLESFLDDRISWAVQAASPAHGQLAGFAKPGQPASFAVAQLHRFTAQGHGPSLMLTSRVHGH
ncbi:hypothetical protein D3C80_803630 [compost metagenome]